MERILVIRLGALGDLIFCFQAFHEIRQAYPHAEIALLTRAPFASFAQSLPWFDRTIIDTHPTWKTPHDWFRLRRKLLDFSPDIVLDLQGKTRQSVLFALLGGPLGPAWSGAAPLCKYPRPWPPAPWMHFIDFLAAQLRAAGIPAADKPDLSWFDATLAKFDLPDRYAVLVPGCSPNAPHKRWPPDKYAEVANLFLKNDMDCVIVGTKADADAAAAIAEIAPGTIDLCGKTDLYELAGILRRAEFAVGNDTGPIHMAAALQTPTVALFSGKSNPVWSRPPGPKVVIKQSKTLADLNVRDVVAAAREIIS